MNLDLNKLTCGVSLTDTEQAVLEYLLLHLDEALKLGVRGVAKANFTSTSTVMRLSRKLGYNGFIEMYYKLLGAVGEGSQSYELNEGFISHFAGEGAVSMENYHSLPSGCRKDLPDRSGGFYLWHGIFHHDGRISGKKAAGIGNQVHFF